MLPTISGLIPCSAVFLPAEPARHGRIAFWRAESAEGSLHLDGQGASEQLTVVTPDLRRTTVTALVLPLAEALPLLTRVRATASAGAAPFWGAATLLALRFAARGLLLPGLSPAGYDAWRLGPLDAADLEEVRELAAAMPPDAHCVPVDPTGPAGPAVPAGPGEDPDPGAPPRLPAPEPLLRAFLDAVADTLPRSPAAPAAAGGPAFAARPARLHPELRDWAAEVAAGHDAGVRVSIRIEVDPDAEPPAFRAVLQMHGLADAALVADAADVWAGSGPAAAAFPPRARLDALRAVRRAARLWPPLAPLLGAAVPDAVDLADEEVAELLGDAAGALAAEGVQVHWPRGLARTLTARAVVGRAATGSDLPGLSGPLSATSAHPVGWRYALGGQGDLTADELDRLAEAKRPLVRLRDQWVLIDPAAARRARALARKDREVTAADALAAVLTGSTELDGTRYDVEATGALERLRAILTTDPERAAPETAGPGRTDPGHADPRHRDTGHAEPVPAEPGRAAPERAAATADVQAPAALRATLRDYQLRGLRWLARLTGLGFGACLADDMGLGKTVTLIALHLHRQEHGHEGPTLVVCPASLLGNWQREIEKFAPGTPVRRFHGAGRSLEGPAGQPSGGFVLTTYGTMRLDAPRLAAVHWGLVVADEAQHIKNPRSSTAKALRTIPSAARVALTGTPVENNLSELWAVLDWTTPGLLGRLGTFRTRYAEPVESGRDPRAAARLGALVRPFLLRRKKSDPGIAPELPPKTETDHAVSLTREQAGLYEAVVRETLAAIAGADGMERRGLVVKLLTSLKQICNHPAQYTKEHHGPKEAAGAASGKLELLDELLDTILAEGGSALVFTQYVAMARIIERHLLARGIPSQLLHGGTPVPRREELVDRFQAGEFPVFLLSLKAAGTGLNLTRAGHVIHYDRWWNPAVEEQATDRAYRIGQTQPVQVHRIIAEGTVEDRIAELLQRKRALADAVLAGGEAALTELSDAELAELVALRPTTSGERHG
ncbi:DEAD/DEAH box helicase [Streptomyces sp. NBC_00335]|uniref:DEAD/DEAH box helicase n=1 Tax=unclassified Streptomyces TaxID=2593676 RepID=UPI0022568F55|nr:MULTISPECIES: DEAD/DEAH box helicase [unclassified Streptomyces]MCX5408839.1 DEAD/DEAH box helicase [Streptomyces sp. NBC_00086]